MRDRNLHSEVFCTQVEKTVSNWITIRTIDLRSKVVDNSNFHGSRTFFKTKGIKLMDLIRLGIISWYLPEEVKCVLQQDLREEIENFSIEDRFLCEQILSTKAEMLIFLIETKLWHTKDFFGNIITEENKHLVQYLKVNKPRLKVRSPQRKRGYHDHGSKVEDHKWLPKSDWTLTEQHNLLEQRLSSAKDTLSFNQGFLT